MLLATMVAAILLAACTSPTTGVPSSLRAQKTTIGGLQVTATPTRLDSGGAAFTIAFDTHTGAPGIDIAASATLRVDGTAWSNPQWDGAGPGGHHRSGTLRFTPAGPARGIATLSITGLDRPVELTWQLTS